MAILCGRIYSSFVALMCRCASDGTDLNHVDPGATILQLLQLLQLRHAHITRRCVVFGLACYVLGAECWVLGARCWVLGAGCRVLVQTLVSEGCVGGSQTALDLFIGTAKSCLIAEQLIH